MVLIRIALLAALSGTTFFFAIRPKESTSVQATELEDETEPALLLIVLVVAAGKTATGKSVEAGAAVQVPAEMLLAFRTTVAESAVENAGGVIGSALNAVALPWMVAVATPANA
jgi:hypothetical protein